jgi:MYXO-CTERM domain-containing protein
MSLSRQLRSLARRPLAALAAACLSAPLPALACGGLFCNNSQPVVQQAENILFVVEGEQTHMHVRISYAGPPQEFGWLLPVPRGVETALSSELMFQVLGQYGPQFQLTWQRAVECPNGGFGPRGDDFAEGVPGAQGDGGGQGPAVQVLSREPVGPYDRAILDARTVEDLRDWLNQNGYQIPDAVDATLRPYVDAGAVFVAIKLLPGEDTGDLVPLRLTYPGNAPTVPIVPTAVATAPDLGIVVNVLGPSRAIPLNYRHVQINEAAIDWLGGGANYIDVVAQAADEAEGRAFTTDFAGAHALGFDALQRIPEENLAAIAEARTIEAFGQAACGLWLGDPDISRILRSVFTPPDEDAVFIDCLGPVGNPAGEALDGAALAARFREEVNTPREAALADLATHHYLTRLFTTMSAEEMTEDPTFAFNPDALTVDNVHQATAQVYQCTSEGTYDMANLRIITESGLVIEVTGGEMPDAIVRQEGQTVRQGDEPAAAVIEQYLTSGAPQNTTDNTPGIDARNGGSGGDDGCGCSTGGRAPGAGAFGLLGLLALGRRLGRRRRA